MHRPDLALTPGASPKFGLGLWNHTLPSALLEIALYTVGVWIYLRATCNPTHRGLWGFMTLAMILFALFLASLLSPPPPNIHVVAWSGLIGALVTLLATIWIDRRRMAA